MLTCTTCDVEKEETEFRKSRGRWVRTCRGCRNAYHRQWRKDNLSKAATYIGNYRGTMPGALRERFHNSCWRAKNKGWAFDLTVDFLLDLYEKQEGKCYFSQELLSEKIGDPNRVSLDRLDPNKGYTQGNVALVCWKINDCKRSLSEEEFIKMCEGVVKNVQRLSERSRP
jgi:hypothetical protein